MTQRSNAPSGMLWTKQLRATAEWWSKFLSASAPGLKRHFPLAGFLASGPKVVMSLDASPYGIGAALWVDEKL
eukprot:886180-Amphidinium_carterae.1